MITDLQNKPTFKIRNGTDSAARKGELNIKIASSNMKWIVQRKKDHRYLAASGWVASPVLAIGFYGIKSLIDQCFLADLSFEDLVVLQITPLERGAESVSHLASRDQPLTGAA